MTTPEDRRREAPDGPEDDMRMDIHAIDVPKSTVAVALILWGILVALGSWTLLATLANREGQIRVEGRVDSLERRVDKLEDRR
jgi:hypothetical protein